MKYLRRIFRRGGTAWLVTVILLLVLSVFAASVFFYQASPDIERPTLILKALAPARCAGEAWGTDLYLALTNQELRNAQFPRIKDFMAGSFAQAILQTAPWERPIEDVKYTFRVLQRERLRRVSEAGRLLFRTRMAILFRNQKQNLPGGEDFEILKELREEERRTPANEMKMRYQSMLGKKGPETVKARVAARAAYLNEEETRGGKLWGISSLKQFLKGGWLPLGLELYLEKLTRLQGKSRKARGNRYGQMAIPDQQNLLLEYDEAIEALRSGQYKGFIERADAILAKYPGQDFSPLLLFQTWSVLKYDLGDKEGAAARVAELKTKYPFSTWGRNWKKPGTTSKPEEAAQALKPEILKEHAPIEIPGPGEEEDEVPWSDQKERKETRKKTSLVESINPLNFVRSYFSGLARGIFVKVARLAADLEPGKIYDQTLDKGKAREYLDSFIPGFAKKVMRGYDIDFDADGVSVWTDLNMGVVNVKCRGRGKVEARGAEGGRYVTLDLQDVKIQGIQVPQAILNEAERGFSETWREVNIPLDVSSIDYWQGGAKVVFKRKNSE